MAINNNVYRNIVLINIKEKRAWDADRGKYSSVQAIDEQDGSPLFVIQYIVLGSDEVRKTTISAKRLQKACHGPAAPGLVVDKITAKEKEELPLWSIAIDDEDDEDELAA